MANPPGENALCYRSGGSTQDGRPAIALPAAARRHVQHSAVGFRGAILSLGPPGLSDGRDRRAGDRAALQSALLSIYLWRRDLAALSAIIRSWRPSLFANFMGAPTSQL
jgi:hypothetical protein